MPGDRRPMWQNPLTNEQYFGLLAMDAGTGDHPLVVDGEGADWRIDNSQVILEDSGRVSEVRAAHDESYLYLRLVLTDDRPWDDTTVAIGFDTVPGGNGGLPGVGARSDTAIVIGPGPVARAYWRASNDVNDLLYGRRFGYYPVSASDLAEGSGVWREQRQLVNRPLPGTPGALRPPEWYELNPLPTGSSDPADPRYESRTVWAADGRTIELRVPWAVVGLADPSSRAALVMSPDGLPSTVELSRLGISVAVGSAGRDTAGYSWEPWNAVRWHERPKDGVGVFVDAVQAVTAG